MAGRGEAVKIEGSVQVELRAVETGGAWVANGHAVAYLLTDDDVDVILRSTGEIEGDLATKVARFVETAISAALGDRS